MAPFPENSVGETCSTQRLKMPHNAAQKEAILTPEPKQHSRQAAGGGLGVWIAMDSRIRESSAQDQEEKDGNREYLP